MTVDDDGATGQYSQRVNPPLSTELLTERLVLHPPRSSEVGELWRMLHSNEKHLAPWTPGSTSREELTSLTAVSSMVLRHRAEWRQGKAFAFFAALRSAPERIVAKVLLSGIMRGGMSSAHLGYFTCIEHGGQGLGSEAVKAVIDFAFGPAGLHRLQAAIMPSNARSLRLIDRLGFRREGYAERYLRIAGKWEDHILFAKTAEEHR